MSEVIKGMTRYGVSAGLCPSAGLPSCIVGKMAFFLLISQAGEVPGSGTAARFNVCVDCGAAQGYKKVFGLEAREIRRVLVLIRIAGFGLSSRLGW